MAALGDIIVDALQELLRILFSPVTKVIEEHAPGLIRIIVGTPNPNAVFSRPTNGSWPNIYDYYWDSLLPLALFLWAISIGLVIFFESTSHLFSGYHRSKLKRRALSGLLGILSWWWIAGISLRLMDALTAYLVPDLSTIDLFQTLSFGTMGVLGLTISLGIDLVLFILIAVIYFTRQVVLYLFVLMMPLLIVFWIPGVGPFSLVSGFMKRLAGFYPPFLFMTVPVAILFRLGDLLGSSFGFTMTGIGAWLIALIIPIVAIASPFVLFWQAGAIFFLADRASHRVSRHRAQDRVVNAREHGRVVTHGSQNFSRGLQGEPPIRRDGQILLGSGQSRAHAAGSRLNAGGSKLRTITRERHHSRTETETSRSVVASRKNRNDDFEHLRRGSRRRHTRSSKRSEDDSNDDRQ